MKSNYWKLLLILMGLQLLISLSINQIYLLSQNTLKNNGKWISMKQQVKMGLLGANNFHNTKVALRQSRLNLGVWHGFQGVIYENQINPKEIEFDFLLTDNAYLYFIFNKDEEKFNGIRVSVNEAFKNVLIASYINGKFAKKMKLSLNNVRKNSWNHFKIIFDNNNFSFFINNKLMGNFSEMLLEKQYFGFRGSYQTVYIDNVLVRQKGSDIILKESFSNKKNRFQSGVLIFLIVFVLSLGVGLFQMLRKEEFKKIVFTLVIFNVIVLFMSLTSLFFYYYLNEIKVRYPKVHGIYKNLMKQERSFTRSELAIVDKRIMNKYKTEVSENINRILFVGTSQTRGAGARTSEETFVRVTEDMLNRTGVGRFECINAGVHGVTSTGLIKYYENSWSLLNPELIIINLSNNDFNKEAFRLNLQRFVDINKSKGIKTIFVLEANSREISSELASNHKIMKKVAEANNILMIDLHKYLMERYDDGILWWDAVHLTSYGQEIMAEFMTERILVFLDYYN